MGNYEPRLERGVFNSAAEPEDQDHLVSTPGFRRKLFTALSSGCHFGYPEGQPSVTKRLASALAMRGSGDPENHSGLQLSKLS
jgi:hypothetical protein